MAVAVLMSTSHLRWERRPLFVNASTNVQPLWQRSLPVPARGWEAGAGDEEDGAPPRSTVDLTAGTAVIRLPAERRHP
ncbi:DUF6191 domain-containing protein [Streptomyces sp. NPDC058464]|uniref:DUF6191 domain-containing protein n=1 Tax=Streptomyces sp. NPDC058464 TaxID=3346511 RepID=UPI003663FDC5